MATMQKKLVQVEQKRGHKSQCHFPTMLQILCVKKTSLKAKENGNYFVMATG